MNAIDQVLEGNAPEDVLDMLLSALEGQFEVQSEVPVEEGTFVDDFVDDNSMKFVHWTTGRAIAKRKAEKEQKKQEGKDKRKKFWDKFKRKPKTEVPSA